MGHTILIIEENPHTIQLVRSAVLELGYKVEVATHGEIGIELLLQFEYALAVVGMVLPGVRGTEICRRARHDGVYLPIVMVSSREDEVEKFVALEFGADEYLAVPINPRELRGRISVQLRRSEWNRASQQEQSEERYMECGSLRIDVENHSATIDGQKLPLTPSEFRLLSLLASQPGKTFSKEQLVQVVWGYSHTEAERVISPHICRLRRKLESDASSPQYIKTTWGVGFYLEAPVLEN